MEKSHANKCAVLMDGPCDCDGYHSFNELYEHRHHLFGVLMLALGHIGYKPWKAKKHADGEMFNGMFIMGMETPEGQITYHLPSRLWDEFDSDVITELEFALEWDGHTSDDVITRLQSLYE